jgi:putative DNA primase/helicase
MTDSDNIDNLGPLALEDFLALSWPEPEYLLEPLIRAGSVSMIAGQREAGKSMLGMGLALACATGTSTLGGLVHAPRRVKTLYLDGENGGTETSQRFHFLKKHLPPNCAPADMLVLTPERCHDNIPPDIGTQEGQQYLWDVIETHGIEILFADNLSTLCGGGDENSAESFEPVQKFLLWLKAKGVATVLLSHVGKDKTRGPRGSSKRTDALSTLIEIAKPDAEEAGSSLKAEMRITKSRHKLTPELRKPLLVELHDNGWVTAPLASVATDADIDALLASGLSGRAIARELGMPVATAARRIRVIKGGKE